jgi:hypothetical protein
MRKHERKPTRRRDQQQRFRTQAEREPAVTDKQPSREHDVPPSDSEDERDPATSRHLSDREFRSSD